MPAGPPILFLDLDDCAAGAIWPTADRPRVPIDREVYGALLCELARHGVSAHTLTNRPPGQLGVLGHLLGGPARYHLAESGLSVWLPDENRAIVNPRYADFVRDVRPEILARLRAEFGLGWDDPVIEEFGTRLVTATAFPVGVDAAEVAAFCRRCRELLADLPVEVRHGKGADIMPAGVNKVVGCEWAGELHRSLQGEAIEWGRVLYVEDSTTGLDAARYIASRGGSVAAVANASPDFREAVRDLDGYLCAEPFEAGVLEAVRRWLARL